MTSENGEVPESAQATLQDAHARLRAAAARAHAATRSWVREKEIQRGHASEIGEGAKQAARDIVATLERAERLADATTQPQGVWEEAHTIMGDEPPSVQPAPDDELEWALEETAEICDMFLHSGPNGVVGGADVITKIDAVLEALGEEIDDKSAE